MYKAKPLSFFSRFNSPAFLVVLTLALGQQGNGRIYFPNVRQPETVRFPRWAWLLGTCPRYAGEQGPEKLCHGDSENQAPCAVSHHTGATREPHGSHMGATSGHIGNCEHPICLSFTPHWASACTRPWRFDMRDPLCHQDRSRMSQGSRTGWGRKDHPELRQGHRGLAR